MKVYKANNKKSKFSAIAVCLLLTVMLAIGGTLAYLFTQSGPVTNIFNPVTPDIEVDEDPFDGEVKTNVVVTNTGKVDSFIRAKVVITWKDKDGNVYPAEPVIGTDYTIDYGDTDWTLATDGYWYYKESVPATDPNDSATTALIEEAKWIKACEYNTTDITYTLNIEILSQSIQDTPVTVVTEKWPVTVSATGVLTPTNSAS